MIGWPYGWRHDHNERSYKVFLGQTELPPFGQLLLDSDFGFSFILLLLIVVYFMCKEKIILFWILSINQPNIKTDQDLIDFSNVWNLGIWYTCIFSFDIYGRIGQWFNCYCWFLTEAVKNINSGQMALLAVKGINLFPSSNEKLKGTIDVWWIVHILLYTSLYHTVLSTNQIVCMNSLWNDITRGCCCT